MLKLRRGSIFISKQINVSEDNQPKKNGSLSHQVQNPINH